MKTLSIIFLSILFNISTLSAQTKKTPKTVFIIVDGIPADVIEKLHPLTLSVIAKTGGFTRSYTGGHEEKYDQTPTISAPGYTNLITGVWFNKHNVKDNDIDNPNYNYWNIFRIAKAANPSLKTAVFSTWQDNRTKLIGEGLEEAGSVKVDHSFDGLELDTVNYPHDKSASHIKAIDEEVSTQAALYIAEKGPDLTWVYLEYSDDMGHKFGDSDQFYNAVVGIDMQVKKIWDAITLREQTFDEDWLIIITTDHGRDAATGKNHGGQSERERSTWIVTNSHELNKHYQETPAVVDILPSICAHMKIKIPQATKDELDGTPFIGPVDFSDLKAEKKDNKIVVQWKSHVKDKRKMEIYIAVTNHFRKGGKDEYLKVGEVNVSQEKYPVSFSSQSEFYKILVRTASQSGNAWIVNKK